ncbi:hypothetical protein RQP46_005273 [Phenoliferia psychrophenolica]
MIDGRLFLTTFQGGGRECIPANELAAFIHQQHHDRNHARTRQLLSQLGPSYYWPDMAASITSYITTCAKCLQFGKQTRRAQLQPITVLAPMQLMSMDYLSLPDSKTGLGKGGFKTVLVVVDYFSRHVWAFKFKGSGTGKTTVKSLQSIFEVFGVPHTMMSDGGGHLDCKEVNGFLAAKGVARIITPPYNPRSNGLVEGANRLLINALSRSSIGGLLDPEAFHYDRWPTELDDVVEKLNLRVVSSTGFRPKDLIFAYLWSSNRTPIPVDTSPSPATPATLSLLADALNQLVDRRTEASIAQLFSESRTAAALQRMISTQAARKRAFDKQLAAQRVGRADRERPFSPGDLVTIHASWLNGGLHHKLQREREGPYRIICAASAHPHRPEPSSSASSRGNITFFIDDPFTGKPQGRAFHENRLQHFHSSPSVTLPPILDMPSLADFFARQLATARDTGLLQHPRDRVATADMHDDGDDSTTAPTNPDHFESELLSDEDDGDDTEDEDGFDLDGDHAPTSPPPHIRRTRSSAVFSLTTALAQSQLGSDGLSTIPRALRRAIEYESLGADAALMLLSSRAPDAAPLGSTSLAARDAHSSAHRANPASPPHQRHLARVKAPSPPIDPSQPGTPASSAAADAEEFEALLALNIDSMDVDAAETKDEATPTSTQVVSDSEPDSPTPMVVDNPSSSSPSLAASCAAALVELSSAPSGANDLSNSHDAPNGATASPRRLLDAELSDYIWEIFSEQSLHFPHAPTDDVALAAFKVDMALEFHRMGWQPGMDPPEDSRWYVEEPEKVIPAIPETVRGDFGAFVRAPSESGSKLSYGENEIVMNTSEEETAATTNPPADAPEIAEPALLPVAAPPSVAPAAPSSPTPPPPSTAPSGAKASSQASIAPSGAQSSSKEASVKAAKDAKANAEVANLLRGAPSFVVPLPKTSPPNPDRVRASFNKEDVMVDITGMDMPSSRAAPWPANLARRTGCVVLGGPPSSRPQVIVTTPLETLGITTFPISKNPYSNLQIYVRKFLPEAELRTTVTRTLPPGFISGRLIVTLDVHLGSQVLRSSSRGPNVETCLEDCSKTLLTKCHELCRSRPGPEQWEPELHTYGLALAGAHSLLATRDKFCAGDLVPFVQEMRWSALMSLQIDLELYSDLATRLSYTLLREASAARAHLRDDVGAPLNGDLVFVDSVKRYDTLFQHAPRQHPRCFDLDSESLEQLAEYRSILKAAIKEHDNEVDDTLQLIDKELESRPLEDPIRQALAVYRVALRRLQRIPTPDIPAIKQHLLKVVTEIRTTPPSESYEGPAVASIEKGGEFDFLEVGDCLPFPTPLLATPTQFKLLAQAQRFILDKLESDFQLQGYELRRDATSLAAQADKELNVRFANAFSSFTQRTTRRITGCYGADLYTPLGSSAHWSRQQWTREIAQEKLAAQQARELAEKAEAERRLAEQRRLEAEREEQRKQQAEKAQLAAQVVARHNAARVAAEEEHAQKLKAIEEAKKQELRDAGVDEKTIFETFHDYGPTPPRPTSPKSAHPATAASSSLPSLPVPLAKSASAQSFSDVPLRNRLAPPPAPHPPRALDSRPRSGPYPDPHPPSSNHGTHSVASTSSGVTPSHHNGWASTSGRGKSSTSSVSGYRSLKTMINDGRGGESQRAKKLKTPEQRAAEYEVRVARRKALEEKDERRRLDAEESLRGERDRPDEDATMNGPGSWANVEPCDQW